MGKNVEFIVSDMGSEDGTQDFLRNLTSTAPNLRVHFLRQPNIHFAKFYNLAISHAQGRILVTLDADNIIGPRYCNTLLALDQTFPKGFVAHAWTGSYTDGTCGRVAMTAKLHRYIGGYDELFEAVGYQDLDYRDRGGAACGICVTIKDPEIIGRAIPNTLEERNSSLRISQIEHDRMNMLNRARSLFNLQNGLIRANGPVLPATKNVSIG